MHGGFGDTRRAMTGTDASDIDRRAPAQRPAGRPVGYQDWWSLGFLHWRVPATSLLPLLPDALTIDTFDGDAFVGLVPFHMTGVRPRWFPAVPGVSAFSETNVRTYVHHGGHGPGVYFLSLDAASRLAVSVARWKWSLPYFHSRMVVECDGDRVHYASQRVVPAAERQGMIGPGTPGPGVEIELQLAGQPDTVDSEGHARPGTLEDFLIERYFLYTIDSRGELVRGQVHHQPYPLRVARLVSCEQSLIRAAGIEVHGDPDHVVFSEGVSVEIFGLQSV